jgi:hypothetical protein
MDSLLSRKIDFAMDKQTLPKNSSVNLVENRMGHSELPYAPWSTGV